MALVEYFGLTLQEINNSFQYYDQKTRLSYSSLLQIIVPIMAKLYFYKSVTSSRSLNSITLAQFAKQYLTSSEYRLMLNYFPFTSELTINKASDSFAFLDTQMPWTQYYTIKEGLSGLIRSIENQLKKNNKVKIQYSEPAVEINYSNNAVITPYTCYYYDNLYLATDTSELSVLINKDLKKYGLNSAPLLRIYAQYPLSKLTKKVWFDSLGRISTSLPIRLIIPINRESGLIMISYTDGVDAEWWKPFLDDNISLTREINSQLLILFPELDIPEPKWITPYYWEKGGNFNKPNKYGLSNNQIRDRVQESLPKNIHIFSQGLCQHPNWIEGTLVDVNSYFHKKLSRR